VSLMRTSDIDRLSQPYAGDSSAPTAGPAAALGIEIPVLGELQTAILADLRTDSPYGIGWWAPHPGTSRRILVSDQLYACTESVSSNMTEAALHWLELVDHADRLSDRMANCVAITNGQLSIKAPRPNNPFEELGIQMLRMHIVGLARASAGALDCLAGTIIGVLALPQSILRADFERVRRHLRGRVSNPSTEGEQVQADFARKFEHLIDLAGPAAWLDWELEFRNMLVHRGRRIELGQFIPRRPVLYNPSGEPIPRIRVVTHLPRDPGRSDVDVLLEPSRTSVLAEDATQTLKGLLDSTKSLVEGTANALLEIWNWRRAHPSSLTQPVSQWPDGVSSESIGFSGYAPGSYEYNPDLGLTHPVIARRMSAAALDDKSRSQWRTFD
jgi:hypothetical protein